MRIGYARVSKTDGFQALDLPRDALRSLGDVAERNESVSCTRHRLFSSGLRRVGLRVLDQREVHPLDFPAILAPEHIDSLPLAVVGAVVPVVPPVAR